MKLFEVIFERDGLTVKAPGITETERKRQHSYYVADNVESVWDAIAHYRNDPESEFISMREACSSVTILPTEAGGSHE